MPKIAALEIIPLEYVVPDDKAYGMYERGAVRVPGGPGLGVELDMTVVERYRIG